MLLDIDNFFNIDLDILKRKVSEILNISLEELDEELEKIKAESKGMAGERTALLFLLDRKGIIDRDLFENIVAGLSIMPISELKEFVKSVTILARIIRIYPEQISKNQTPYQRILVDDATGKAFVTFFGNALKTFKDKCFKVGDAILIRRGTVTKSIGKYTNIIATDKTRVDIPDEHRYNNLLKTLPDPPIELSVKEFLESQDIFDENDEIDIQGVIGRFGEVKEFERKEGSIGKRLFFYLFDKDSSTHRIRCIAWNDKAEYIAENVKPGMMIILRGARVKKRVIEDEVFTELHLNKLSTVDIHGEHVVSIEEINKYDGEKVVLYGFIANDPNVRTFQRDGEESSYIVTSITDGESYCRVVIWSIDNVINYDELKRGAKVRIYGRVKSVNDRFEIHVSSDCVLEVNPEGFPLEEPKVISEEVGGGFEDVIINDFEDIFDKKYVNLIGTIEFVEISDFEKIPNILILGDKKGNRVKIIGWDRDTFEKLKEIGVGNTIEITNLKTNFDEFSQEYILKFTQKTDIKTIDSREKRVGELEEIEFMSAKDILEEKSRRGEITTLSEMSKLEDLSNVIASILIVKDVKKGAFCSICGAPMIKDENICENGHMAEPIEQRYIECILEDGNVSYDAIILENALKGIFKGGEITEAELRDLVENMIGLDYIFSVQPKIGEDNKMHLIVKNVSSVNYREILSKLEKED